MIKIGIFVEGQTERIFIVKFLIEYLGGEQNFSRKEILNLGSRGTKIVVDRNFPNANYYILIFDSPSDLRSMANSSIWVDISGLNLTNTIIQDDYFVSIRGALYYDPQYIDYAIKAIEIVVE